MTRFILSACAVLMLATAPVRAQTPEMADEPRQRPHKSAMRGALEGFALDVGVVSQPTAGGSELIVTNNGDPGYVLIGCFFCTRGTRVSSFVHDMPAGWPDDRILFGFKIQHYETVTMFVPAGKLALYEIPVWVLDSKRNVIARWDMSAYDGESP